MLSNYFNIYDEIRLLSGVTDDPEDKRIFAFTLCEDCTKRSKRCSVCKLNNSQASLQQMQELNLLRDNLQIMPNGLNLDGNEKFFVQVNFPVLGNVSELYAANLSNSNIAKRKTVTLFKKLRKLDLAVQFHSEIIKGVSEGNTRFCLKKKNLKSFLGPIVFLG